MRVGTGRRRLTGHRSTACDELLTHPLEEAATLPCCRYSCSVAVSTCTPPAALVELLAYMPCMEVHPLAGPLTTAMVAHDPYSGRTAARLLVVSGRHAVTAVPLPVPHLDVDVYSGRHALIQAGVPVGNGRACHLALHAGTTARHKHQAWHCWVPSDCTYVAHSCT